MNALTTVNFEKYFCTTMVDKIMMGVQFKKKNQDKTFYKITHRDEFQPNYLLTGELVSKTTYKTGLNEDCLYLSNLADNGSKNSPLTFFEKHQLSSSYCFNGPTYIRKVEIVDDSAIFDGGSVYSTNKCILGEREIFGESHVWEDRAALFENDPSLFMHVGQRFQTKELCEMVAAKKCDFIDHVREDLLTPTTCICLP